MKQLLKPYRLRWDEHRIEDPVHDLFLTGWLLWRDAQEVALGCPGLVSRFADIIGKASLNSHR